MPCEEILQLITAGNVDDGKSTLIGKLLYDSQQIYTDQIVALERDSNKYGTVEGLDYSLLLDGLKAEREQKITIDVAYRYFCTSKRKFILADTPGHKQYTRNMITAASRADLLLLLIHVKQGIIEQTKRHFYLSLLMGIKEIVVVVNKMDLVLFSEESFQRLKEEFIEFAKQIDTVGFSRDYQLHFIPVCATEGDNIVHSSQRMPWFKERSLLTFLEEIPLSKNLAQKKRRFPIQFVIRPNENFRGYAGTIASGTFNPGDHLIALPSGIKTSIRSIFLGDVALEKAYSSQSVTFQLTDEIDLSRGDLLIHENDPIQSFTHLQALLIWLDEQSGQKGNSYLLKHTSKTLTTTITDILYTIDMDTLKPFSQSSPLVTNEIALVQLELHQPLFTDAYTENRTMGSFILIDRFSHQTVAAGLIAPTQASLKESAKNSKGGVLWLTGLSGSGKTTLSKGIEKFLHKSHRAAVVLDGDVLRRGLNKDLGFSAEDRSESARRVAEVATLFAQTGSIVIVALITPYQKDRERVRHILVESPFFEIYLKASLEVCQKRDPKGFYEKALKGEISNYTGISDPYEVPLNPYLTINTEEKSIEESVEEVIQLLQQRGMLD